MSITFRLRRKKVGNLKLHRADAPTLSGWARPLIPLGRI